MYSVKKKSDKGKDSIPKKRPRQLIVSSDSSESDQGDEGTVELFEIERIVARKPISGTRGKFKYLIKWFGYSELKNTWETERHLNQYANWLSDFNRAEDLKAMVKLMLSGSKAAPEAFAGIDMTGLGVAVPGLGCTSAGNYLTMKVEPDEDSTGPEDTTEEDPFINFDADSSSYSEMAEVTNHGGATLPLGACDVELDDANNQDLVDENSHGAEDLTECDGHTNLEVMEVGNEMEMPGADANPSTSGAMDQNHFRAALAGPLTTPGKAPVITSVGSVPQSDLFATNQKLVRENKLLKAEQNEKDDRIKQLESELRSVKCSRRLLKTKGSRDTDALKDALNKVAEKEKDLEFMETRNKLLKGKMNKIQAKNNELAETVIKRERRISALRKELESRDSHEDRLKEGLFKQQEQITVLERALVKAKQEEL